MGEKTLSAVINPQTGEPVRAIDAFAAWLALHEPALFAALEARAAAGGTAAGRTAAGRTGAAGAPAQLGSWTSILSDVSSGISSAMSDAGSAISSVGGYLTSSSGLSSLSALANTYLTSQAQQQVTQAQLSLAQSGQAPAPISYEQTASGQVMPIYSGAQSIDTVPVQLANGSVGSAITSSGLAQLTGGGLSSYLPWLIGAGALAAILLMR